MTPGDLWWLGSALAKAAGRAAIKFWRMYRSG